MRYSQQQTANWGNRDLVPIALPSPYKLDPYNKNGAYKILRHAFANEKPRKHRGTVQWAFWVVIQWSLNGKDRAKVGQGDKFEFQWVGEGRWRQ